MSPAYSGISTTACQTLREVALVSFIVLRVVLFPFISIMFTVKFPYATIMVTLNHNIMQLVPTYRHLCVEVVQVLLEDDVIFHSSPIKKRKRTQSWRYNRRCMGKLTREYQLQVQHPCLHISKSATCNHQHLHVISTD